MYTGKIYSPIQFFKWTYRTAFWTITLSIIPTVLFALGYTFLALPWQPITMLGTAVSLIVGFKNNASYGRIWEARQIYGVITNDSRSFAYTLRDALGGKDSQIVRQMFLRHFAWLTALRYQLREPRGWENLTRTSLKQFIDQGLWTIPERMTSLKDELKRYLADEELRYVLSKQNYATQLAAIQSQQLSSLRQNETLNDFQWTQLQSYLARLTDSQGRAERIKNFPYPRNFASITTILLFIFVVTLPFGLLDVFDRIGYGTILQGYSIWFNVPFSSVITWVFHTLDNVGEASVNPFEGNANDVPITQISRTIEIDMRDMLDEDSLPEAILPKNNIVL